MTCKFCGDEMAIRFRKPCCQLCDARKKRKAGAASRAARVPARAPNAGLMFPSTPATEYAMDIDERRAREPIFRAARTGDVEALRILRYRYRLRLPLVEATLQPQVLDALERVPRFVQIMPQVSGNT